MLEHINKIFMGIIILSLLTFFERADYNLPLFAFAMILWNLPNQKVRLWYLMAFSLLVDVIWIIYWAITWNSYANRELGLCNFAIVVSVVILILKLIIVIILFAKDDDCKRALSELPDNAKSIFTGQKDDYGQIR